MYKYSTYVYGSNVRCQGQVQGFKGAIQWKTKTKDTTL
jgi:hypothetical protein